MERKYIFWALVVVWMMVIYNFSSDDKEASSNKSEQVTAVVQQVASKMPQEIKLVASFRNITEHFVRKIGHVLEYFMLTILVIAATAISGKGKRRVFQNAVLIPILFAISDELHQLYTPGRGPQVVDVVIDGIGIIAAIAAVYVLYVLVSIYKKFQGEKI